MYSLVLQVNHLFAKVNMCLLDDLNVILQTIIKKF